MIGVPLSSAPLTASAIAPSRATAVAGGGAPGVSACWSPAIFPSPSNRNVSVAVPSTDPGGNVAVTVATSPSMTGSDHVAAASIGCTLPVASSTASRPSAVPRGLLSVTVVGEHRRDRLAYASSVPLVAASR